MRINTNVMALNAQNKLTSNQGGVEKSIQKLSSGLRINGAADDAAGLAISEKMRAQIRGLSQAGSNAQDGISLLQTAEGALQQTTDILQRMRELVIKAQNTGVLTTEDKSSISTELSTLREEIDRIATSTTFNGKKLLDGTMGTQLDTNTAADHSTLKAVGIIGNINVENALVNETYTASVDDSVVTLTTSGGKTDTADAGATTVEKGQVLNFAKFGISITIKENGNTSAVVGDIKTVDTADNKEKAAFKIGANVDKEDTLSIGIGNMKSDGLSIDGSELKINIDSSSNADIALKDIDYAINKVSSQRAQLGVVQNRMEYAANNLSTTEENLTAAESRIRDVDMAEEMVSYTKNTILNQSAMAMLAQANQQPQTILSLLQ